MVVSDRISTVHPGYEAAGLDEELNKGSLGLSRSMISVVD